jgi:hypothetical protein
MYLPDIETSINLVQGCYYLNPLLYKYKAGIGSTPTQLVRSLLLMLILAYTGSTLVHLSPFGLLVGREIVHPNGNQVPCKSPSPMQKLN